MANLIVNGGLSIASSGTAAPGADADALLPAGSTAILGWTVIGGPDTDDQLYWFGTGFNGLASPDADAVALTGNINIEPEFGLEQTIATTPGQTYALTFDIGTSVNFPDPPPDGAAVSVTTGDQSTLVTGIITNGTDDWTPEEVDFTATSASTVIIIQGDAPGAYIGLDDIALDTTTNPVPPVNLVTDGSFNQAAAPAILPGTSDVPYGGSNLTSGSTAIVGWTVTANGPVGWIADDSETPDASPSGVYALNLADNRALASGNQGGAPYGGVTQTIATTPGTTYQLTFELGNDNTTANTGVSPTGGGIAEPSGSAAMPGWTVIGGTAGGNDGLAWLSNANPYGVTAETGSTFVSLAGYHDNSPYFGVTQTIATTVGQSYALTFWLGVDNGNANYTGPIGVSVTAGPVTQTIDNVSPTGSGNQWVEETVDFTASATSSVISIQGVRGDQYIGLDNVSVVQTGNGATGTNLIANGEFAEPSINPVGVSVTAGPVTTTLNNVDPTTPGSAWTPETVDFTATSTTSTISIQGDQGQDYIGLGNVAVSAANSPAPVTGETFSEDGTIDTFTVPTSGTYVIDAVGATGGGLGPGFAGGAGAEVEGTFALTGGDVLRILVGEAGYGGNGGAGSGGGGSFVFDATTDTLLEAAGGGGGASVGSGGTGSAGGPGSPGQAGTSGTAGANYVNGAGTSFGGAGGTDGGGGAAGSFVGSTPGSDSGGGGGGFSGSGGNGAFGEGGDSFLSGGAGGTGASLDTPHDGGFGGGGGTNSDSVGAGGGGGFSGGGGGEQDIGGGGGSFIAPAATTTTLIGGENADGNGTVTITPAGPLTGPDMFTDQAAAMSGPYTGQYLWNDPANWSQGLPANGDSVEIEGTGVDDLPALITSTLTLTATQTSVVGASLSATTIVASPGAELVADAALTGAPVAVTVGAISGTGGSYGAAGTGGGFVDNGASDPGSSSYVAALGGLVELAAPPAASSTLDFNTGGGTIALDSPAASSAVHVLDLAAGDTLELPGSSVQSVTGLGTPDVTVTTSAGSYAFTDVTYSGTPVDGYTLSHDGVTGLEAITFVAPDLFTDQVAATSGPYSGFYLWSNAANWSQGLPVNGDNVVVEGSGADDLASLTLGTLTLAPSQTSVVGGALSAAAVTASSGGILEADAALAGSPVAVTVGAIDGTGGIYSAAGAGGGFVDNSASDPGSSSYVAALGGLVELAAAPAATSTLDFNSGGGTIALADPAASNPVAIENLGVGDTLELPGSSVQSVTGLSTPGLTVTTSAGIYAFTNVAYDASTAPIGYTASHDSATGLEAVTFVACFGRGTLVLTDRGERPVETLVVGDLVPTVLSDVLAPIIWVGHRNIDCTRHPEPQRVWPVRVAQGAFGAGRPHSDLFLSPNHAVYLNDVLIPIRHLLNGSTITQVPMDHVTYYHIELPSHDVVLAQGLPAESFLDLRDGSNYANRPGPVRVYPDYSARMWEAFGCARLVVTGPELAAARALVASVAEAREAPAELVLNISATTGYLLRRSRCAQGRVTR